MKALKFATFNINGIRSRLPALLAWLEREQRIYTFWDNFHNH
ncbi:exodeoxyribonuclease-3 [Pseudomonas sp. RV120224-01b]|jgi:exodeoxyribonuclease-3|nr:exodeoxyribonuclease-3 [Pseudomonas sp. RV120224-01c]PYG82698.1 exodeoxyribonuclease-3 [Pseudomonas sp. RV120224-01b]